MFEMNEQTCELDWEELKNASSAPERHVTGFLLAARWHTHCASVVRQREESPRGDTYVSDTVRHTAACFLRSHHR